MSSLLPPTHLGECQTADGCNVNVAVMLFSLFALRLNLRELGPLAAHMRWFVWLMAAAGTIYVFNYHEK